MSAGRKATTKPAATKRGGSSRAADPVPSDGSRTRGGWEPVGTAERRRAVYGTGIGQRGRKARAELVKAARVVFERDGYANARIEDIVKEAQCARGSFYTYFPSKLEVFQHIATEVAQDIYKSVSGMFSPDQSGVDPATAIDTANRNWVETYSRNREFLGLLEQVSTIDPQVHAARLEGRLRQVARIAAIIERWQKEGLADASIDARTTAGALQAMQSNFCYWWMVGGDPYDHEAAIETMNSVWTRAIGIAPAPPAAEV
jgi:AcrR family transcriptional regulator